MPIENLYRLAAKLRDAVELIEHGGIGAEYAHASASVRLERACIEYAKERGLSWPYIQECALNGWPMN